MLLEKLAGSNIQINQAGLHKEDAQTAGLTGPIQLHSN